MRRIAIVSAIFAFVALAAAATPAVAEVEKAVIDILGGMQCTL